MTDSTVVVSPFWPTQIRQSGSVHDQLLARQSIRLFSLDPALELDTSVTGCLEVVDLQGEHVSYEAISYVWGDPTDTVPITVNGHSYKVTVNLHDALRRLRHTARARRLWIDAICINQVDVTERNIQVAMMADIYTSATRVCI